MTRRLLIGWGFGTLVSLIGTVESAVLDLPSGATVVCAFGLTLLGWWGMIRLKSTQAPCARASLEGD